MAHRYLSGWCVIPVQLHIRRPTSRCRIWKPSRAGEMDEEKLGSADVTSRSRDRMRPGCANRWPTEARRACATPRRARGMPGARCTRSRAWCVENTRVSHHGRTGITRHSRTRVVLTVSFVISLVIGLFVTIACGSPRKLDAGIEAPGPHDFAVRRRARSSKRRLRPPHPAPTSVTIAKRPSAGRDGRRYGCDLGQVETKIFLQMGLDRRKQVDPVQ